MVHIAKVSVSCDTFGTHTHQIFSGLNSLKRMGIIELHYVRPPKWLANRRTRQAVYLVVQHAGKTQSHFYDLNDSSELAHPEALVYCDIYHKRSFCGDYSIHGENANILPYGLNYQVSAGSIMDYLKRVTGDWIHHPYNPMAKRERPHINTIIKYSRDILFPQTVNRELIESSQLASFPSMPLKQQVLFQCRLWDPASFPASARESIEILNTVRVESVRALKKELGERFIGGLQNNAYARAVAWDLVVSHSTNRSRYLDLVKQSAVVVTTNGISDSIGWKMGEFVALAKAIVCEPLIHKLPGLFESGRNYLPYQTSHECVARCVELMENSHLAQEIMENNYNYFNRYVRPDVLMFNSFRLGVTISETKIGKNN